MTPYGYADHLHRFHGSSLFKVFWCCHSISGGEGEGQFEESESSLFFKNPQWRDVPLTLTALFVFVSFVEWISLFWCIERFSLHVWGWKESSSRYRRKERETMSVMDCRLIATSNAVSAESILSRELRQEYTRKRYALCFFSFPTILFFAKRVWTKTNRLKINWLCLITNLVATNMCAVD